MESGKQKAESGRCLAALVAAAIASVAATAVFADEVVRDTWQDGTLEDPLADVGSSENGVDADKDGDIECAWFRGGGGALAVVGKGGPLKASTAAGSSSSWTTHFAPDDKPVTLAEAGDQLKLTWTFTPTGVNETDAGQAFRVAIVDAPTETRLKANGSPASGKYSGYALFMNMNTRLSHSKPLDLRNRTDATVAGALLSTSGDWTPLAIGGREGSTGYGDGKEYTLEFTATRNDKDGLDLAVKMSGGELEGGAMTAEATDPTPASFTFDTFAFRPVMQESTAKEFDVKLFKVEKGKTAAAPKAL